MTHRNNGGLLPVPSRRRSLLLPSFSSQQATSKRGLTQLLFSFLSHLHVVSESSALSSIPKSSSSISLIQRNWWWWMAKNNKYTSINLNYIYDKNSSSAFNPNLAKNPAPSLSPSYSAASYSAISAPNKTHGRMLVLTRPTPKPLQSQLRHPPQQQSKLTQQVPDQPPSNSGSDAVSLRPLGRTVTGSSLSSPVSNYDKDKELPPVAPVISSKSDKFVPPHLRPGFVPRENKPEPELSRPQRQQGRAGYPGRYGENGRPKSGGYERMRRGGLSDMGMMTRPRSSGSRPSYSG